MGDFVLNSLMTLYMTIFFAFLAGLFVLWGAQKLMPNSRNPWQTPLFILAGVAIIILVIWYVLEVLIGLPSPQQVVDIPAILLGLLISYGFQNAVITIKQRAASKKM